MNFILSLAISKIFKYLLVVSVTSSTVYYLVNIYHYKPIKDLKSIIKSQKDTILIQENSISNLKTTLKIEQDKFKKELFECENSNSKKLLNQELQRIDNDKTPKIDTSIGTHTLRF